MRQAEAKTASNVVDAIAALFEALPITWYAIDLLTAGDTRRRVASHRCPRGFAEFVREILVESPRRDRRSKSESTAVDLLRSIADAEQTYRERKGRFASLEELRAEKALDEEALGLLEKNESGYKFAVAVSGAGDDARYYVTATPAEYGRWGRISYFVDETRKLRAADKKGDPASASDEIYGGYDPSLDAEPVDAEPGEAPDPEELDGDDLDDSGDFDEP